MAYIATSGGRTYRVDVHTDAAGLHVHLDAQAFPVDVLAVGPTLYSILVDGRSYEVDCLQVEDAWIILVDGQPFRVALQDEAAPRARSAAGNRQKAAGGAVTAAMPGKVVKVHVATGEIVAAGAPLCTLEAMKMENEVAAAVGGTVTALHVAVGQTVQAGQVLLEIEVPETESGGDAP
jgi:biotin carboxyl carrier protein